MVDECVHYHYNADVNYKKGRLYMRQGFTLIEMLLVLSIMILLGSFVIPNIKRFQTRSFQMASEVNVKTFQSAIENYYLDANAYPAGNLNAGDLYDMLKAEDLLNSSPINPYTKAPYAASDTKGKIIYSNSGDDYTLTLYGSDGLSSQVVLHKI